MSDGVDLKSVSELSESQKTCLRLVRAGLTSKEIARRTGLSDKTIDQYMSRAVAILGVPNRHAAAEALELAESASIKVSELQTAGLAEAKHDGSTFSTPAKLGSDEGTGSGLDAHPSITANNDLVRRIFWLPPVGGKRHDFDGTKKTTTMLRIAFAAIVGVAAIVTVVRGVILLLKL